MSDVMKMLYSLVDNAKKAQDEGRFERKALDYETRDALEYINKVVGRNYDHLDKYLKEQLTSIRMLPPDYDTIKKLMDEIQEKILIVQRLVFYHDYHSLEVDGLIQKPRDEEENDE